MSVLVAGASIAGLSVAQGLGRRGFQVTVVERSPELRRAGSPIDVRGEALGTATDMGILARIAENEIASSRRASFTTFVDEVGREIASLPAEVAKDSPDDIEVARDKLIDILHESIDSGVEFVFDDSIEDLTDTGRNVEVTFERGSPSSFDLVVGADGIHSTTRRAAFGPESSYRRHLGVYYAILQLPAELGVPQQSRTYNAPGRMATISDFGDRTLGWLAFRSPEIDHDHRDLEQQRRLILDAYSDVHGWRVAEIMDVLAQASEFHFDSVSQVHMDRWSCGRVVLTGDAAHAASLFSGRGTSLAMMGADILARELAEYAGDTTGAFARYEEVLRPAVSRAQEGVREARDCMVPDSWESIDARNRQFMAGVGT